MANPYRLYVQPLLEKSAETPTDSELLVSNITGHILVNTPEGRRSATKKIEADLSRQRVWIKQVNDSIQYYKERLNSLSDEYVSESKRIYRDKNFSINLSSNSNPTGAYLVPNGNPVNNMKALATAFNYANMTGTQDDPVTLYIEPGNYPLTTSNPDNLKSGENQSIVLPSNTVLNAEGVVFNITPSNNLNQLIFYGLPTGDNDRSKGVKNFIWNGGTFTSASGAVEFKLIYGQYIFQNITFNSVQPWGGHIFTLAGTDNVILKNNLFRGYASNKNTLDMNVYSGNPNSFISETISLQYPDTNNFSSGLWNKLSTENNLNITNIQNNRFPAHNVLIEGNYFLPTTNSNGGLTGYSAYPLASTYDVGWKNSDPTTSNSSHISPTNTTENIHFIKNTVVEPLPNGAVDYLPSNNNYETWQRYSAPIHIPAGERDIVISDNTFINSVSKVRNWISISAKKNFPSINNINISNNKFIGSMSHIANSALPYTVVGAYTEQDGTSARQKSLMEGWIYSISGTGNTLQQVVDTGVNTLHQGTYNNIGSGNFSITNLFTNGEGINPSMQLQQRVEISKSIVVKSVVDDAISKANSFNPKAPFVYGGALETITRLENLQHFSSMLQDIIERRLSDDSEYLYSYYERVKIYLPDFISKYLATLQLIRNMDEVNYIYKETNDMMVATQVDFNNMINYFNSIANKVNSLATKREYLDYANQIANHNRYVAANNDKITADNVKRYLTIEMNLTAKDPIGTSAKTPQTPQESNNLAGYKN